MTNSNRSITARPRAGRLSTLVALSVLTTAACGTGPASEATATNESPLSLAAGPSPGAPNQGASTAVAASTRPTGGASLSPSQASVVDAHVSAAPAASTTCPYKVVRNTANSWLLTNPKVYIAYWGNYWTQTTGSPSGHTEKTQYDATWSLLASSIPLYTRLHEYGIGQGQWLGSTTTPTGLPASGSISESQVTGELQSEINAHIVPAPDANTVYIAMLPPGLTDSDDTTNGWIAHHQFFTSGSTNVAYAVIEYGSDHPTTNAIISHELSEAATDPEPFTGWDDTSNGEIGDFCQGSGHFRGMLGQTVQMIWSQRDCACIDRFDPSNPDFNGDWVADLAVTGSASDLGTNHVGVALGTIAAFSPTKVSTSDFNSFATTAGATAFSGDFDGDGFADLAAAGVASWSGVKVAYGHGDGTFGSTVGIATSFGADSAIAGAKTVVTDVDGDGRADFVSTGAPGATAIAVAFGAAASTFRVTNVASTFASQAAATGAHLVAGDFDDDGRDDLALVGGSTTTVPVAFSNGDGTFRLTNAASSFAAIAAQTSSRVVVGDVDGDGRMDLIAAGASSTTITAALSKGDGTFNVVTSNSSLAGSASQKGAVLVAGDFNGDSQADVAATGGATWTTVPIALGACCGDFSYANPTSDFAGYAAQTANRVVDAVGYPVATSGCTTNCPPVQINAGGPAVSPFVADEDFSGGSTIDHANTIDLSGVTNPAPMAVYQAARIGNFTYTIGGYAPGSSHTVRLHFAETYFSTTGSRVFDVSLNGSAVLTNFDIVKAAGAENKAIAESFTTNANASGAFVIQFTSVVNNSLVSGIEVN